MAYPRRFPICCLIPVLTLISGCDKKNNPVDPDIDLPEPITSRTAPMVPAVSPQWLNPKLQSQTLNAMQFLDAKTGYLVGESGTIVSTADAGETFSVKYEGSKGLYAVRFFDADWGIAVGDSGILLTTRNGGETWTTRYFGQSPLVSVCTDPSGTALVVGYSGTLLKSSDRGQTWSLKNSGTTSDFVACAFTDSGHAIANTDTLLLASRNLGDTWAPVSPWGNQGTPVRDLSGLLRGDSGSLVGMSGGAAYQSRDGGHSWRALALGTPGAIYPELRRAVPAPGGNLFLVGSAGVIVKVPAGGTLGPIDRQTTTTFNLRIADFPSKDTGFAAGAGGEIVRTFDGGKSWMSLNRFSNWGNLQAVDFPDAKTGFIVGDKGTILKTVDGGRTWIGLDGAGGRDLLAVHFLNAEIGCAVGKRGTALWTKDGGANWIIGGLNSDATLAEVYVLNASTAYIVSYGTGNNFKTLDGGNTWVAVASENLPRWLGQTLGDGLLNDGIRIVPGRENLLLDATIIGYSTRPDSTQGFQSYFFIDVDARFRAYSPAQPGAFYALGGQYLFRGNSRKGTLLYQNLHLDTILNGIDCQGDGTCYLVGDQGTILKFKGEP